MPVQTHGSFFGRHTTLWQGNLFMIFVTDNALHFGRVSDRFDAESALTNSPALNLAVGGLGGLAYQQLSVKPALKKRAALEAKYRALEPGSAEFLQLDKRNFTLTADQVERVTLKKTSTLAKSQQRVGSIDMVRKDGGKYRLELASSQPSNEVERLIRLVFSSAEGSLS